MRERSLVLVKFGQGTCVPSLWALSDSLVEWTTQLLPCHTKEELNIMSSYHNCIWINLRSELRLAEGKS